MGSSVLSEPIVRAAARRCTGIGELGAILKVGRPLAKVGPAAAVGLLLSGIYLAGTGGLWGAAWVQVALALWIVNCVVAVAVVRPAVDRVAAEAAAAAEGPVG